MIARKITYKGQFSEKEVCEIYDITRKIEITGVVQPKSLSEVELQLEGDPSMIKLVQHQIERKIKDRIQSKTVDQIPYQYFKGIQFLN